MNQYETETHTANLINQRRYEEALPLLHELAERGSAYAYLNLGWLCENGDNGPRNVKAARYYYERAAVVGDPDAYRRLGCLLVNEGELHEGRAAFEKGAKMGNLGSMYRLGNMLIRGEGGPRSENDGVAWLECAAKQGHLFSERRLISIKSVNSKSFLKRIAAIPKIAQVAYKLLQESRRNIYSDKLTR